MLCSIFSAAARNFIHPGLLHSQDDLKRITRLVKENSYPAMGSYDLLRKVPGASFEYEMKGRLRISVVPENMDTPKLLVKAIVMRLIIML